ncbi:MAG: hypothetical protein V3U63_11790 [Gemmatimonadota bacterium]
MRSPSGFWGMLAPKRITMLRKLREHSAGGGGGGRLVPLLILGAVFWLVGFGTLFRILKYFRGVEDIGDLLAAKLFGLILLTFFGVLLLSNVITALSTFFLSRDLELLMAAPSDWLQLYLTRLGETLLHSSWMVGLICLPILAAYGTVFGGGLVFYVVAAMTLLPLFIMLSALGSAVTVLLVSIFPARRAKDILGVITVGAAGGLVLLIRLLRPESLTKPEGFRNLGEFLALLRGPTSPWIPSEWSASATMEALQGSFDPFPLVLLWTSALGMVVLGAIFHARAYISAYTRSQTGAQRHPAGRRFSRSIARLFKPLGIRRSELVLKDVRVFFRDTTQWSQLILLSVLVVVYIYNISALPLHTEGVSFFFAHVISFLNVGLAGFVLSAIAARFVFPALSIEGPALWLLKSSPLDARDLLWTKYWVGTVPLLIMAILLTIGTNLLLEVGWLMMTLSVITIAAIAFALSALALAFGAIYPQFKSENMAQISTSLGGLLFMMAAVSLVGIVLVLESWPVLTILRRRMFGMALTQESVIIAVLGGLAALAVCTLATIIPLRVTLRRIEGFQV